MPSLSSSWFQSGGTDAMLVKDAYQVSTSETRNLQYDSVKGIYSGAIDGLYTNKGSARTLYDLVQQSKTGTISKTDMITRALGAMGSSLPSLLGSLGGALVSRIESTAGALFGDDAAQTIAVLYKDLPEKLLTASQITDYQDPGTFLAGITGDSELMKLIHVEAESAILGAMAGELLSFGIPGIIDDVIATSASEQVRANAYAFVSTSAVKGSDLAMINTSIDQIGVIAFLEANPNAINDILSMYYLGTDDTVEVYPERRALLVSTLERININWDKFLRNGVYIPNLEPFTVVSGDAKTLLAMAEPQATYLMIAPPYKSATVNTVLSSLYPNAHFS